MIHTHFSPIEYEARNRLLLYTRSIALPPIHAVSLALEALQKTKHSASPYRHASPDNPIADTMHSLYSILHEKSITFQVEDGTGMPLQSSPPIQRSSMVSEPLERNICRYLWHSLRNLFRKQDSSSVKRPSTSSTPWEKSCRNRRFILMLLTALPSLLAGYLLYTLFNHTTWQPLLLVSSALFTVLFYWISVGFWNFMAGIVNIIRKVDRFAYSQTVAEDTPLPHDARTALLFPIYNEDAQTVFAGIRTVWQSLRTHGLEQHFDIFILSDSTKADAWVNEEEAWHELCQSQNAHAHIFYRRRKMNLKRKSGNIADFCRRWGILYRYMIIFDADSLMSAQSLKRLVQIMEKNPDVGIVQSLPKVIKSQSLLARVQQFANHLYGPIFAAGLHFWRLGNTQYWGHNAIIRVQPFMKHCQLAKLPGRAPLGGEILSHDFVESALMRRAGYGVWLDYETEDSFEQCPPSLMDELIRDRRWCQGNLQHSRLIFTRGFFPTHRALFANGIMSYVSALLWLLFLLTSSVQVIMDLFIVPEYFPADVSLTPTWPQYFPHWLIALLSCTATLLFLPKVFVIFLTQIKGQAKAFGGFWRMSISVVAEVCISTFLAPVRMLFHSSFVMTSLFGHIVSWSSQNRADTGTSWGAAIAFHWWGTALGLLWSWFMYMANPEFFWWFFPVAFGLIISIPLSVWTSKVSVGKYFQRCGFFLTPPETQPSEELLTLEENLTRSSQKRLFDIPLTGGKNTGFVRAVIMHRVLALHTTINRPCKREPLHLQELIKKAIEHGPANLSNAEKILLLNNTKALQNLHRCVWTADTLYAARWGIED